MPLLLANRNSTSPSQHCWSLITLQGCKRNWPKSVNTNMVVPSCMLDIHKCMTYHLNQNVSADAKRYHTFVYVEHTWSYDHICTQLRRSVSSSGHGNTILKHLTQPTRVRIRPAPPPQMSPLALAIFRHIQAKNHNLQFRKMCFIVNLFSPLIFYVTFTKFLPKIAGVNFRNFHSVHCELCVAAS